MHGVEIITLDSTFGFDTPPLSPLSERAVFLGLCNDPEVDSLFCCFIVSEMMVVRVVSEFQ